MQCECSFNDVASHLRIFTKVIHPCEGMSNNITADGVRRASETRSHAVGWCFLRRNRCYSFHYSYSN
jgi:hypothetical protein